MAAIFEQHNVPFEIAALICGHLSPRDFLTLPLVSRAYHPIFYDDFIWSKVVERTWPMIQCEFPSSQIFRPLPRPSFVFLLEFPFSS
jgi:hypothetical protein